MKISKMTLDQAAEALIRISAPVSSICDDEKLDELLEKYRELKEESIFKTVGQLLPRIVAYAIKEHKKDFYEIVSVLSLKTVEEVANMTVTDTIKVIKDSYDEVLASFFTSLRKPQKNTEE